MGGGWSWLVPLLVVALQVSGSANASPVTYFFSSGHATVTATTDPGGVSVMGATSLALDGVFVEFDDGTIGLVDFSLTVPNSGLISLDSAYGGYDQIVIESADLSPGTGYSTLFGQLVGPGQYTFVAGPIDINGTYSAYDSTNTNPPVMGMNVPFTDTSLISGSVDTNLVTLELTGITLAKLPGVAFGETDDLEIKADIVFTGVVPEPGTAGLLGIGLLTMGCWRRASAS